jgi:hypothetical protein
VRKWIDIVLKILLSIILVMPILGALGVFPPPAPDLYNTPQAFEFIETITAGRYITITMVLVHIVALACLWTRRTGLAALLILPITVNVVGFHAFLDGGLLTPGAIPGNIMLLINAYFLWQQRREYAPLLAQTS